MYNKKKTDMKPYMNPFYDTENILRRLSMPFTDVKNKPTDQIRVAYSHLFTAQLPRDMESPTFTFWLCNPIEQIKTFLGISNVPLITRS